MTDLGTLEPHHRRWSDGPLWKIAKGIGVGGLVAILAVLWRGCLAISDAKASLAVHSADIADLKRSEGQTALSVAYIRGIIDERASVAEREAGVRAEARVRDDMNKAKIRPLPGAP